MMSRILAHATGAVTALLLVITLGCAESADKETATGQVSAARPLTASINGEKEHAHDGWWCDEHGVPEEVCGQCSSKVAADFQRRGDWCREHDRPDSQCFVCHPELEAKFAAQYEAKLGKKPPKSRS
jgi:hypothetical protein